MNAKQAQVKVQHIEAEIQKLEARKKQLEAVIAKSEHAQHVEDNDSDYAGFEKIPQKTGMKPALTAKEEMIAKSDRTKRKQKIMGEQNRASKKDWHLFGLGKKSKRAKPNVTREDVEVHSPETVMDVNMTAALGFLREPELSV